MIQVYFTLIQVHDSDTIYIFDGPDTSSPLIGTFNNLTIPTGVYLPIDASLGNASGCITVRFVSNGTLQSSGFMAEVTCEPVCQDVIAALDMNLTSPSPDTNYIAVCPGTEVNFSANAVFPENNMVYNQSENATTYEWVFGDGTTASGENVSHQYNDIGGYTVSLFATDQNGCRSSNSIETRVVIAGNPYSSSNPPPPICANDTLQMDFDMLGIGGTIVEGTPFSQEISTTLGVSDTTFLPDGSGICYETSVVFNCFEPGQELENPQDFLNLSVNMEHSYLGDLEVTIYCPNGQSLILHEYGSGGGGTFLGEPVDNDYLADGITPDLTQGIGYTYSWTPIAPPMGTWAIESGAVATLAEGVYTPEGTFFDLVGCPLNGEWTIEICDNLPSDNGYIYAWEMTLNPDIAPDSWDYTVPIDQFAWTSGPHIIDQNSESITISPPVSGIYNYTYNIIDHYGCSWDTTISVEVLNSPIVNLGPDLTFCPGVNSHLFNAQNPGNSYIWQDNSTNSTFNATVPGDYSVTVSNGLCADSDEVTVFPHNGFTLNQTHTDVSCFEGSDGTITQEAISDYPPYFFNWSDGQTGEQATGLPIGTYYVTITDNNGCQTYDTANIAQPTELTASYITNVISCFGGDDGEINLEVQGGVPNYTYLWNNGSTSEDLEELLAGNYSVLIKDANNCLLSLSIPVSQTEEIVTALPGEHYYCSEFEELLLTSTTGGTSPYIYLWSDNSTAESISITPSESTTYRVTITDSHDCSIVDEVTVLVHPDLELITTIQEDTVCLGETTIVNLDVTGGSGSPYSTYLNGTLTNFPIELDPSLVNDLNIEVRDGCFNSISENRMIFNHPLPEVNFASDIYEGCPPLSVQFNYTKDCENCAFIWEFSNGVNTPNTAVEENPQHLFDSGIYDVSLMVQNQFGCKNSITKHQNIYAYPKPKAKYTVSPDVTSIITPNISFKNLSEDARSYIWNFGNGQSSDQANPYYAYQNVGEFESELIAFSRDGCSDTSRFVVKIKEELTFYVPEAFTPDNDGKNETFNIFGNGIIEEGFLLQVYNRWGEMIFETTDLHEGWNGKYFNSNKVAQSGNYSWVCVYTDIYNATHEKSGFVGLIR